MMRSWQGTRASVEGRRGTDLRLPRRASDGYCFLLRKCNESLQSTHSSIGVDSPTGGPPNSSRWARRRRISSASTWRARVDRAAQFQRFTDGFGGGSVIELQVALIVADEQGAALVAKSGAIGTAGRIHVDSFPPRRYIPESGVPADSRRSISLLYSRSAREEGLAVGAKDGEADGMLVCQRRSFGPTGGHISELNRAVVTSQQERAAVGTECQNAHGIVVQQQAGKAVLRD